MQAPRTIAATASMLIFIGVSAMAQDYPRRPIRLITTAAGGGGDFVSRVVADGIAGPLGQPVIVDNRSGFIPGLIVSKAPADGYTLAVVGGTFWLAPLQRDLPYDTARDYSYISILIAEVNALVVTPSLPVKTVADLMALARAKAGYLNVASTSGGGGTAYLAGELFKSMAQVKLVGVPHKSAVEAYSSLMNGDAHLMFPDLGPVLPLVKAGKLRMLAVTSAQPSALAPGVPTVAANGLPGFEVVNRTSVVAPAKVAPSIVVRLNREIVRALNQPDVRTRFLAAAMEPVASSPEEMTVAIKSYIETWTRVLKELGLYRTG